MARLSRTAGDRLRVLGVASLDVPANSVSFAADNRLPFPSLQDRDGDLERGAAPQRAAGHRAGPARGHDRLRLPGRPADRHDPARAGPGQARRRCLSLVRGRWLRPLVDGRPSSSAADFLRIGAPPPPPAGGRRSAVLILFGPGAGPAADRALGPAAQARRAAGVPGRCGRPRRRRAGRHRAARVGRGGRPRPGRRRGRRAAAGAVPAADRVPGHAGAGLVAHARAGRRGRSRRGRPGRAGAAGRAGRPGQPVPRPRARPGTRGRRSRCAGCWSGASPRRCWTGSSSSAAGPGPWDAEDVRDLPQRKLDLAVRGVPPGYAAAAARRPGAARVPAGGGRRAGAAESGRRGGRSALRPRRCRRLGRSGISAAGGRRRPRGRGGPAPRDESRRRLRPDRGRRPYRDGLYRLRRESGRGPGGRGCALLVAVTACGQPATRPARRVRPAGLRHAHPRPRRHPVRRGRRRRRPPLPPLADQRRAGSGAAHPQARRQGRPAHLAGRAAARRERAADHGRPEQLGALHHRPPRRLPVHLHDPRGSGPGRSARGGRSSEPARPRPDRRDDHVRDRRLPAGLRHRGPVLPRLLRRRGDRRPARRPGRRPAGRGLVLADRGRGRGGPRLRAARPGLAVSVGSQLRSAADLAPGAGGRLGTRARSSPRSRCCWCSGWWRRRWPRRRTRGCRRRSATAR